MAGSRQYTVTGSGVTFPNEDGVPTTHVRGAVVDLDPDDETWGPEILELLRTGWLKEYDPEAERRSFETANPQTDPGPVYRDDLPGLVPQEVIERDQQANLTVPASPTVTAEPDDEDDDGSTVQVPVSFDPDPQDDVDAEAGQSAKNKER
jgi:hypothetical protein